MGIALYGLLQRSAWSCSGLVASYRLCLRDRYVQLLSSHRICGPSVVHQCTYSMLQSLKLQEPTHCTKAFSRAQASRILPRPGSKDVVSAALTNGWLGLHFEISHATEIEIQHAPSPVPCPFWAGPCCSKCPHHSSLTLTLLLAYQSQI